MLRLQVCATCLTPCQLFKACFFKCKRPSFSLLTLIHSFVWRRAHKCACRVVCGGQRITCGELALSSHRTVAEDRTQVLRFGGKCLYGPLVCPCLLFVEWASFVGFAFAILYEMCFLYFLIGDVKKKDTMGAILE